jgi:glycosyltransferase involved in cell wall biosynthesis
MDPKRVSIVIPTFNQSQYLWACLDSVYFQDYPNLEIVVVNDASTDQTRNVLKKFVRAVAGETVSFASFYNENTDEIERTHHPRYPQKGRELKILHNDVNRGSTWTYNRGFRACTGDYCTYVVSDDLCNPSMVSTLVQALDRDEADFVYSDMFLINDDGCVLRQFDLPDYSFATCFCDWYRCGVSKIYRRALHDQFGYYNEDYLANDHECYLRFAMNGVRFLHIPRVLYSVRSHEQREKDVHAPSNWNRLLDESRSLVKNARAFRESASDFFHAAA